MARSTDPPPDTFGPQVVECLDKLDASTGEHYQDTEDDRRYAARGQIIDGVPCIRFGTVKRYDLPRVEGLGVERGLELGDDEALIYPTHMSFFPGGVVGMEINNLGPRLNQFVRYLREVCPDVPKVKVEAIVDPGILDRIDSIEQIVAVEIALRRQSAEVASSVDFSGSGAVRAVRAVGETFGAPTIAVRASVGRTRRRINQRAVDQIKGFARDVTFRDTVDKFRIDARTVGEDGKVEIDVLKEHLVSRRQVTTLNASTKAVEPSAMFQAIIGAHKDAVREIEDGIRAAVG